MGSEGEIVVSVPGAGRDIVVVFCGLCCLLVLQVEEDGVLFSLGARTCFGFPGAFVLFEEIGSFFGVCVVRLAVVLLYMFYL